jgi:hypothetical protein
MKASASESIRGAGKTDGTEPDADHQASMGKRDKATTTCPDDIMDIARGFFIWRAEQSLIFERSKKCTGNVCTK